MSFEASINIEFQNQIGRFLNKDLRKAYTGGIAGIIGKNKKIMQASSIISEFKIKMPAIDSVGPFLSASYNDEDDRDFFKIDYTYTDVKALQNFRVESYRVAGVGSYKLMKELRELSEITTRDKQQNKDFFIPEAKKIMLQYVPLKDLPPAGWLETNYNTGVGSAYHGAEYIRLQEPLLKKIYAAYKYMTRNDSVVRKSHRELHGLIFMQDDKIWLVIYPPNGWNCRCFIIPIDVNELAALMQAQDANVMSDLSVSERGRIIESAKIDPLFNRNPGATQSIWEKYLNSELKEIDYDEVIKSMQDYANANRIPDSALKSIDIAKLQEANSKLGKWEKREIRDVEKEILVMDLHPDYQQAVLNVIKKPTEIWGKDYMKNGVKNSELFYLQFHKDGVSVVTVFNGQVISIENVSLEYADKKFRRHTLIYMPTFTNTF